MATKLSIYQGATAALGERTIMALTENRESRRALDDVWSRNGALTCLAVALWNFAQRSAAWDYSPDFTPPFGYKRAFDHPPDWVRWTKVCEDEFQNVPLLQYVDENEYLYCDLDRIYVSWVSSDIAFGMNLAKWPDNFSRYVELYFARQVVRRLTNSDALETSVDKRMMAALKKAKGTDAMNEATQFLPPGSWSQARHGRRGWGDRGSKGQLIG